LNYTREEIFDCRFSIADCNRNKFALQIAVVCSVLSASSRHTPLSTVDATKPLNITATKSRRRMR